MTSHVQPIQPAATVILAREAEGGFELFMLRRTSQAAFAGGYAEQFYISGFSSRGPTPDGRAKPDVVAPGVDIVAARSSSNLVANGLTSDTELPFPVVSAIRLDDQLHFDPYRYVLGLAQAAAQRGADRDQVRNNPRHQKNAGKTGFFEEMRPARGTRRGRAFQRRPR